MNKWGTYKVQVVNFQSIFLNRSDFVSSWNLNHLNVLLKYLNAHFFRMIQHHVPELRQFKVRSKLYSLFWTNGVVFEVQVVNFQSIFLNWSHCVSSWNYNPLKIKKKKNYGIFFRRIWRHVPEPRQFKVRSKMYSLFRTNWVLFKVQVVKFQSVFFNWSDFVSSWNLNHLKMLLKSFNGNIFRRIWHHVPELNQFKVRSKLYSLFLTNWVLFKVQVVNFQSILLNLSDFVLSLNLNHLNILFKSFN